MEGSKIGSGILLAFGILGGIMAAVGGLYLLVYILSIVLGSIFQISTTGDLPVTAATNTFLNETQTSFFAVATDVTGGAAFAASLIPVAVILLVFGALIVGGYMGYKKITKKSSKGDMGY